MRIFIGILAVIGLTLGAIAIPTTRKAIFCSEIVNPYELSKGYVVVVNKERHRIYNADFIKFAKDQGLAITGGQQDLSEFGVDSNTFKNYQSIGCDGKTLIWSENVAHPDDFLVTIYYNKIFGKANAKRQADIFLKTFENQYPMRETQ